MRIHIGFAAAAGAALLASAACRNSNSEHELAANRAPPSGASSPKATDPNTTTSDNKPSTTSQKSEAPSADKTPRNMVSITGKLASSAKDSVTVEANGAKENLKLDGSTRILIDGQPASVEQLKQGSDVRATYQFEGKDQKALTIDATSGNAPAGSLNPGDSQRTPAGSSPSGDGRADQSGSPGLNGSAEQQRK